MQRFHDATTTWFTQGENPETVASTPEVLMPEAPSRRPQLILGAVGVGLIVFGVTWSLIHKTRLPAAQVRAVPVADSTAVAAPPPAPVPVPAPVPALTPSPSPSPSALLTTDPTVAPPPVAPAKPAPKLTGRAAARARKAARLAAAAASPATFEVVAGEALLKRGQYAAALEQFQKLLVRQPSNTRALRGACTALDRLGRKNDAARVCRHALNLDPDDVSTRSALASIYFTGGAYQWSANEWRLVLAARPGDPQALRGLRRAKSRL